MMRRYLFVIAAFVLSAGGTTAQETTTGSIAGRVVDSQGLALPGATVEVVSAQGTRTLVTDGTGRFVAPFLVPGIHSVRVSSQGLQTVERNGILLRLGERLEFTFSMTVGLAESVEVAGTAVVVDLSSTTAGTNVEGAQLSQIPLSRRLTDVLYVAPGVSSGGRVGQANASIAGSSGLENYYSVDGVNITNAGFGGVGSYSGTFGSLGTALPYDFIEQIQIKTAGADAEYGQATGGLVNVITRSGANKVRGAVFAYGQPDFLEGDWQQVELEEGVVNTTGTSATDLGFVLGGPILQNRLFYFAAFNPAWEHTDLVAPEGFPLRSLGDVTRDRRSLSYAAKLTAQFGSAHRIEASFFGDPSRGDAGPQRPSALLRIDTAGFSEVKYGGNQQSLRYNWIVNRVWFLEASVSRAANAVEEIPVIDEWSVVDRRTSPSTRSGGIGTYTNKNNGSNVQYNLKSTHILGSHQIRYGALYEDIHFDEHSSLTGPPFTLPDGRPSQSGASVEVRPDPVYGQIYRVDYATIGGAVRETKQNYLDFFVQDTWRIGRKLTLRPGLRYEQQKLIGAQNSYKFDGNWAPRIGVTFDPTGTGRSKIYAQWGRFFNKLPNNTATRSLTAIPDVRLADYFDANLTQPVPLGVEALGTTVHFRTASGSASSVQPGSKSGYQDEFVVGAEREIGRGVNVGIRYTHRSVGRIFEDIANAAMVLYFEPDSNVDSLDYFLGNPGDNTPATLDGIGAFEKGIRKYDAVELTAEKRFANHWALLASYRWSRLHGTFEGYFLNDTGEANPGLLSLYDFPTNDPTYTEIGVPEFGFRGDIRFLGKAGQGPLPTDRPHQAKIFGNYSFDMGLNIGLGLLVGTGRPLTPMAAIPVYEIPGIPESPRGSGIETVDGMKERTPAQFNVDLNASYWRGLGGERRIGLLVDVFNLFDLGRTTDYDQNTEIGYALLNPDYGKITAYQSPLKVRMGLRFEF